MTHFLRIVFLFIIIIFLNSKMLKAQSDSIRHQIGLGTSFASGLPYLSLAYKKFLGKRYYIDITAEGFTEQNNSVSFNNKRSELMGAISIGLFSNFLKICRINFGVAMLASSYKYYHKSYNVPNSPFEIKEHDAGLFFGAASTLEVKVVRFRTSEIALFSRMQIGYGNSLERSNIFESGTTNQYYDNDRNHEGSLTVGVNYRFGRKK